jgi:GntR family transcriptional repressor for pyruvate dehydrogenase complex
MAEINLNATGDDELSLRRQDVAGGAGVAATFAPVRRSQRLSDQVADDILDSIKSGQLKPGDHLPSERGLSEQFGVSRTVVREAVRSLAAKGVLDVRPGSGVHIAAANAATVSEQISLFLGGQRPIEYRKIHQVRAALEVQTARLAAERATDDDLAALRAHCERVAGVTDSEAASLGDVEFHRLIARATHNELFVVMLDSIGELLLAIRRVTLAMPGRLATGLAAHQRILAAVAAHDVEGSGRAMRDHLEDSIRAWRLAHRDGADASEP